jgi:acyl-[acyl-carrier-protein]-phospholipid O-acyltransferase/long-chain-fatty-acid--[acyl-carrier-protein] ligase
VNGVVAAFFALQSIGRVPAMLNFTVGVANMRSACMTAAIRTVVTARAFVDQARLHDVIAALEADGLRIVWLEDVGATIGAFKSCALLGAGRAERRHLSSASPMRPPILFFTSGSEACPGRCPHPPQPVVELRTTRRTDRFQRVRHRAQRPAGIPLLRPDRRHPAAAA